MQELGSSSFENSADTQRNHKDGNTNTYKKAEAFNTFSQIKE